MSQQIIKVVVKGKILSSVETRNVHYYGADTTTPGATQGTDLENAVGGYYNTLGGSLSSSWTCYGLDSYYWDGTWWNPLHSQTVSQPGAAGGDLTAFQIAALVTFKTAIRKCLGKKFIPGIPEGSTTNGSVTGGLLTALGTFATSCLASVTIAGVNWYPGVPSKNSVFAPFISGTVGTILSTMRRRKPGYGI